MNSIFKGLISFLIVSFFVIYAIVSVFSCLLLYPVLVPLLGRNGYSLFLVQAADKMWILLVWFMEDWCRLKFEFSGDEIPPYENAIVLVNHQWFLDWWVVLCVASRKGRLGVCKFFAKKSIIFLPGFGMALYMLDCVFLSRNWEKDQKSIDKTFQNLKNRKIPFWMIFHPEGTRKSEEKLKKSHEWAKKKDLPMLNHVLLPKTKGFLATIKGLNSHVNAIYDLTIVYNNGESIPDLATSTLRYGSRVNIHVRRYPIKTLPTDDQEIKQWCTDRWIEKDQLISQFLKDKNFPNPRDEPKKYLPFIPMKTE